MSCNKLPGWCFALIFSLVFLAGCASKSPEKAISQEQAAQQQAKDMALEGYQQALALHQAGELEQAKNAFTKLAQAYPDYAGPKASLALIAMQEGDDNTAEKLFLEVIEVHPDHVQSLTMLGVLARKEGRFTEAEGYYRRALAIDPDYPAAVRNLGILLELYRGELQQALALYEHYQTLVPDDEKVNEWVFDLKQRLK